MLKALKSLRPPAPENPFENEEPTQKLDLALERLKVATERHAQARCRLDSEPPASPELVICDGDAA
jgi:hypothetical protein